MAQAIVMRGATGGPLLTGDALASNVLEDKTFYNTDLKTKVTGTLAKSNVLSSAGGTIDIYTWSVTPITNS